MADPDAGQDTDRAGTVSRSKVGRVIDRYGLDGLGADLERRWTGDGRDRQSLRELETYFNQRVLEAALADAGHRPVDGEVANLYRLLTDDDVATGPRTEAETTLARRGVDLDAVRGAFVSHQAIHTYLTSVREVAPPDRPDDATPSERRRDTIQRLRNRLAAVSSRGLEGLRDAGHLEGGSFDVTVGVTVYCEDCGATMDVADLLDQGGCECGDSDA